MSYTYFELNEHKFVYYDGILYKEGKYERIEHIFTIPNYKVPDSAKNVVSGDIKTIITHMYNLDKYIKKNINVIFDIILPCEIHIESKFIETLNILFVGIKYGQKYNNIEKIHVKMLEMDYMRDYSNYHYIKYLMYMTGYKCSEYRKFEYFYYLKNNNYKRELVKYHNESYNHLNIKYNNTYNNKKKWKNVFTEFIKLNNSI